MTYYEYLVGASFRPPAAQSIVLDLRPGDLLTLLREPDNAHDQNAIMVIDPETKVHLGYVGRALAAGIAPLLDAGASYECQVFSYDEKKKPYLAIDID